MAKLERILSDHVKEPEPGLWSNCKRCGEQVFISGLVPLGEDGAVLGINDPGEQARVVFRMIQHYVEAAGGKMNDVVRLRIYVTDMRHRPAVLAARREFFSGDFPCSTLVGVSTLVDPAFLVEIDADAIIGAGAD
ncbi:MAG: putative aminoacrylate peracid reductase RutC [Alphaproteobacteria bacterium MarineAlpha10_Bin1]|nr:MAG: putative aminoacrylate peracid reductase RutC [Alphaproteobacteria bacterium MarineAlpha10_Bin1]